MEVLTRLVADSLARHGLDRPIDPRRLQWSRWSRCDSPHSLLVVPSKPGIFALAEEVMDFIPNNDHVATTGHVGTAAIGGPAEQSSAAASSLSTAVGGTDLEGHDFSSEPALSKPIAPKAPARRMLAIFQFSEDDDMAFTLDRMFTRANPMSARFASGRCFLRFVVIENQVQRRSICATLNQWLLSSAEKASGLPADFQSSMELPTDRVGRTLLSDSAGSAAKPAPAPPPKPETISTALDSGASKNLHCPHPLPSGF